MFKTNESTWVQGGEESAEWDACNGLERRDVDFGWPMSGHCFPLADGFAAAAVPDVHISYFQGVGFQIVGETNKSMRALGGILACSSSIKLTCMYIHTPRTKSKRNEIPESKRSYPLVDTLEHEASRFFC